MTWSGDLVELLFTVADKRSPATSPLSLEHVLFNDGTPGHTTTDGSVKLVGIDEASITTLLAPPIPGSLLQVQVQDGDEDRNSGLAETVTVRIINGLQTETIILTETGPNNATFEGSITTAFSLASTAAASSGDNIVQVKAGDPLQVCFDDSLDVVGNTVEVCVVVPVNGGADGSAAVTLVSQPGDPIYIEVADADLNANIGSAETVNVTVQNSRTLENFNVVLTEVDFDDDVFFGSLPTTSGPSTAVDMNTAEEDVLTLTYVDALTVIGGQQNLLATDDVINPWGDADDNEALQAFDAAQILIAVLSGGTYLTGVGELAANVDIDPVGRRSLPSSI